MRLLAAALILGSVPAWAADLPDPKLTPGAARTTDRAEICTVKTSTVRRVTTATKRAVLKRYGLTSADGYHLDHLVPLGLGGSNVAANVWPEPVAGQWGDATKNRLEAALRAKVCANAIPVTQAQQEIATDWIAAYKRHVGPGQ